MKELLQKLSSLQGLRLNPPASQGDIEAAEARLGGELPEEVGAICEYFNANQELLRCRKAGAMFE